MKWYVYDLQQVPLPVPLETIRANKCQEIIPPAYSFSTSLAERVSRTWNPDEADYFLVPLLFNVLTDDTFHNGAGRILEETLNAFAWFSQRPSQHVVFVIGDCHLMHECCHTSPTFMVSCSKQGRALPMYYHSDTPQTVRPIDECDILASFHGTATTYPPVRKQLADELAGCRSRPVHVQLTDGYFHMYYTGEDSHRLRHEFLNTLDRSQFVFCPRGAGLSSMRFYETLAWGRLPILVADQTALPLVDRIPYEHFVVRVPESDIAHWESYVDAFLAEHPDLQVCADLARQTHLQWFNNAGLRRFIESSLSDW